LLPAANLTREIEKLKENLQTERDQQMYVLAAFNNYRRQIERNRNRPFMDVKNENTLPLWNILNNL
jgi:molecular chaperone GrpE (heat shock protein)